MTDGFSVTIGDFPIEGTHDGNARLKVTDIDGWGVPAVARDIVQRARAHGAIVGEGFLGPRFLTLTGSIISPTVSATRELRDALFSRFPLDDTLLTVVEGGATRYLTVSRSPAEVLHRHLSGHGNNIKWSAQFVAADPRKFGAELTDSTGLPSSSGGLTFPHEFPHSFDATSVSGRCTLTNEGTMSGKVRLRLTGGSGGLVGPQVAHVTSGRSIVFATSLTIPEGVYVDVDMDAHTILEQGTASRAGWVTERGWSQFEPGDNEWQFTAISGDGTLEVTAWPAWM